MTRNPQTPASPDLAQAVRTASGSVCACRLTQAGICPQQLPTFLIWQSASDWQARSGWLKSAMSDAGGGGGAIGGLPQAARTNGNTIAALSRCGQARHHRYP